MSPVFTWVPSEQFLIRLSCLRQWGEIGGGGDGWGGRGGGNYVGHDVSKRNYVGHDVSNETM